MDPAILELFAPFGFAGITTGVLLFFFFKNQSSLQSRVGEQEKAIHTMMAQLMDRSLDSAANTTKVMAEVSETLKTLCTNMDAHRVAVQSDHVTIRATLGTILDRTERKAS